MVQANAFWQLINFLTSGTWFKIIPFPLHSTAAGGPLSGHVAPTNESHVATQATFAHAQRPAWSGCCWRVQQLQLNQSSAALLFSLAPPTSSAALRLIPNPTDENLSPPPVLDPPTWFLVQLPLNWYMLTSKSLGVERYVSRRYRRFQTTPTGSVEISVAIKARCEISFFLRARSINL